MDDRIAIVKTNKQTINLRSIIKSCTVVSTFLKYGGITVQCTAHSFLDTFVIQILLSLVFIIDASTSSNNNYYMHKDPIMFLFLVFALQQLRTKYRWGITQAQRYLPHEVMFDQWKYWIQITLRLNRSDDFACAYVCVEFRFHFGSSLLPDFVKSPSSCSRSAASWPSRQQPLCDLTFSTLKFMRSTYAKSTLLLAFVLALVLASLVKTKLYMYWYNNWTRQRPLQ